MFIVFALIQHNLSIDRSFLFNTRDEDYDFRYGLDSLDGPICLGQGFSGGGTYHATLTESILCSCADTLTRLLPLLAPTPQIDTTTSSVRGLKRGDDGHGNKSPKKSKQSTSSEPSCGQCESSRKCWLSPITDTEANPDNLTPVVRADVIK